MKKIILCAAIAAAVSASTTASAKINLHDKDGLKVEFDVNYQVQYRQDPGVEEDLGVDFDDLELKFGVEYDLSNGMTAIGQLDLESRPPGDGDEPGDGTAVDEGYVGIRAGAFTTTLGRQYYVTDDFGISKGYEFDLEDVFPTDTGDAVVKFVYDAGNYRAALSQDLDSEGENGQVDFLVTAAFGNISAGLAYQDDSTFNDNGDENEDTLGIMASMDIGPSNIGIDYSTNEGSDTDHLNLAADYTSGQTTFGGGVTFVEEDDADDLTAWYLNLTYSLHSKVDVFGEIGGDDADDTDVGYLAGMVIKL